MATLALEVRYFIVFPAFEKVKDWLLIVLCFLCAAFVIKSLPSGNGDLIETRSYRDLFGVLPLFLIGYMLYRNIGQPRPFWARGEVLGVVIGVALFASIKLFQPVRTQWVGELALAFLVTPTLLVLALKFRTTKYDHLAGYLSYGVFLVHIPVIRILRLPMNSYFYLLVALVLSTAIALVLHFAVERKVLAFRHGMVGTRGIKTIQT